MIEQVIELDKTIDYLIDVTHDVYLRCTDEHEKIRLEGKINAYCEVKRQVEDILKNKL